MLKLVCKVFGHKWRWFQTDESKYFRVCRICGKVHYYKWHMSDFIWVMPVELTELGAKKRIENYDGI